MHRQLNIKNQVLKFSVFLPCSMVFYHKELLLESMRERRANSKRCPPIYCLSAEWILSVKWRLLSVLASVTTKWWSLKPLLTDQNVPAKPQLWIWGELTSQFRLFRNLIGKVPGKCFCRCWGASVLVSFLKSLPKGTGVDNSQMLEIKQWKQKARTGLFCWKWGKKRKTYVRWEQGCLTSEKHRDAAFHCMEKICVTKADLELKLARNVGEN